MFSRSSLFERFHLLVVSHSANIPAQHTHFKSSCANNDFEVTSPHFHRLIFSKAKNGHTTQTDRASTQPTAHQHGITSAAALGLALERELPVAHVVARRFRRTGGRLLLHPRAAGAHNSARAAHRALFLRSDDDFRNCRNCRRLRSAARTRGVLCCCGGVVFVFICVTGR